MVEQFIKGTAAPKTVAAANDAAPAQDAPAAQQATEEKKPGLLAEGLKEMRARREREAAETQRKAQYETENQKLKSELERYKASSQFEDDPIGYARSRGWDKSQQITFAKALMYDLAPDQADPDFRIRMFEMKQEREKKAQAQEAEERKQRETVEASHQEIRQYAEAMEAAVMSFDAGSYPDSEAWYGDSVEDYLGDMFKTANKLAKDASKKGILADLSPQAVAKQLEADVSTRFSRRQSREQPRQPEVKAQVTQQKPATPAPDAVQSVDTASTKDMSGGGVPQSPARTDKERIQRAIAAGWGGR